MAKLSFFDASEITKRAEAKLAVTQDATLEPVRLWVLQKIRTVYADVQKVKSIQVCDSEFFKITDHFLKELNPNTIATQLPLLASALRMHFRGFNQQESLKRARLQVEATMTEIRKASVGLVG